MFFDFAEIDEETTRKIAKEVLSNYHRINRFAGGGASRVTSAFSITPRSETNVTSDETALAAERSVSAQNLLEDIHKAIDVLSDDVRKAIYFKYISEDGRYDYEIIEDLMISKDTFYRWLAKGQVEFAQAFRDGGLVVYKGQELDKKLIKELLS